MSFVRLPRRGSNSNRDTLMQQGPSSRVAMMDTFVHTHTYISVARVVASTMPRATDE